MMRSVNATDLVIGTGRTTRFEGEHFGSGVSFFLVDNDPGQGSGLHQHPSSSSPISCGE